MKSIQKIRDDSMRLNNELREALMTMTRKDDIYRIKKDIVENQSMCPHYSSNDADDDFAYIEGICPFCGKKLYEEDK